MRSWLRTLVVTLLAFSMMLAAAAPAHAVSREGTWRGRTSESYPIRFRVSAAQRITFVTFKVVIDGAFCSGTITWSASHLTVPIRADKTFVVKGQDGLDHFVVRGEFVAKNRAKGTVHSGVIEDCVGDGRATWVANRVY
jgi:hypothetical protein